MPRLIHDITPEEAPKTDAPRPVTNGASHRARPEVQVHSATRVQPVTPPVSVHDQSPPPRQVTKKWPVKRRKMIIAIIIVIVVAAIAGTGYIVWLNWFSYDPVEVNDARAGVDTRQHKKKREATKKSKIPVDVVASYKVPPLQPRVIRIPKLNIEARLMTMGLNDDGSMQAPVNINDAGWYNGSSKPSEVGAVTVDGHSSGDTNQGLFGNLEKLNKGDEITIETGDGKTYSYTVAETKREPLKSVDMESFMLPYGNNTRGLNLMTCDGDWIKNHATLDHRISVYAVPAS